MVPSKVYKVDASKFCVFYESYDVVACAKYSGDVMGRTWKISAEKSHDIRSNIRKTWWNWPKVNVCEYRWLLFGVQ